MHFIGWLFDWVFNGTCSTGYIVPQEYEIYYVQLGEKKTNT